LATEFIPIPGAGLAVDSFIDNMDNADLNPTSSIVLAALGVETNNRVTYSQIVEKYNEIKD